MQAVTIIKRTRSYSTVLCVSLSEKKELDAHDLLEEVGDVDAELGAAVHHLRRTVRAHVFF